MRRHGMSKTRVCLLCSARHTCISPCLFFASAPSRVRRRYLTAGGTVGVYAFARFPAMLPALLALLSPSAECSSEVRPPTPPPLLPLSASAPSRPPPSLCLVSPAKQSPAVGALRGCNRCEWSMTTSTLDRHVFRGALPPHPCPWPSITTPLAPLHGAAAARRPRCPRSPPLPSHSRFCRRVVRQHRRRLGCSPPASAPASHARCRRRGWRSGRRCTALLDVPFG